MPYLKAIYRNCSVCNDQFQRGIEYLNQRQIPEAVNCFNRASSSVTQDHPCYYKYISYLGLSQVLTGEFHHIHLCRAAAACETRDGDVFLNLARAELFCDNRYAAVMVIQKGLEVDVSHEGLMELQKYIGRKRKALLPFLPRNHPVNNIIGKHLRKNR